MAKAVVVQQIKEATLMLTGEEAAFLRDVMNRIGGDTKMSRRRIADAIDFALRSAGVCETANEDVAPERNGIYFTKESK
jgi:hypothetical protein